MYPSVPLKEPEEEAMSASLSHLRDYFHFRIFYLTTQLSYLNSYKGEGPWDKEDVENQRPIVTGKQSRR